MPCRSYDLFVSAGDITCCIDTRNICSIVVVLDVPFIRQLETDFFCQINGGIITDSNKYGINAARVRLLGFIVVKQNFFYPVLSPDFFDNGIKEYRNIVLY